MLEYSKPFIDFEMFLENSKAFSIKKFACDNLLFAKALAACSLHRVKRSVTWCSEVRNSSSVSESSLS
jgi:hypothetical protein